MEQMDILLKTLETDLLYHLELYPDGKYGFSYSGYDGSGRRDTRVMVYDTKAECVDDMAQNIKNHVLRWAHTHYWDTPRPQAP